VVALVLAPPSELLPWADTGYLGGQEWYGIIDTAQGRLVSRSPESPSQLTLSHRDGNQLPQKK
jgi:hypothetical protein